MYGIPCLTLVTVMHGDVIVGSSSVKKLACVATHLLYAACLSSHHNRDPRSALLEPSETRKESILSSLFIILLASHTSSRALELSNT
jgi:hypothetical protein